MSYTAKQRGLVSLIVLRALLIAGAPSQAQQLEISFSQFRQFSLFGSESGSGGFPNGPIGYRDRGPGSVSFGGTTTAKTGPGIALIVIGAVNPAALLLLDLNVEMTAALSGPQSFGSATARNRCNLVEGNVGGFIERMIFAAIPVAALVDAIRDHVQGTPHLGTIACSTYHSDGFGDLRDGSWNLTVAGGTAGSALAGIELNLAGELGGVTITGTPARALQLPGNIVETIQYRYACLDGLEWDGIENRCVCKRYPPGTTHPLEECRAVQANCGPRQIEQDGGCIDCGPGAVPINNVCVNLPDGDDPDCDQPGSPCYCARHPNRPACAHCEMATETEFINGEIREDAVLQCDSTFPWTGPGVTQTLVDCLFFDAVCYFSQFTKTVPDLSELPPTGHLSACSEGLGWRPCNDTNPDLRELVPDHDYLELFPECFVSSTGVPITTCGTTLPDGEPKPDLTIVEPHIVTTHPTAGEPVFLSFGVANQGTEAAPNATWLVQADTPTEFRTLTGVIGSLAAGGHRTFELSSEDLSFVPDAGSHTFRVIVDHNHSLTELNENNNMRLMATLVSGGSTTGGTDLITNVTGTTIENPTVGQEVTLFVTVTNIGQSTASESQLMLSVTDPAGNWLPEFRDIGTLSPGQSVTESVIATADQAGSLWLTARADAGFDVAEDDESNNDTQFGLQFAEADACLPCTSGAPDNGVGSLLCFPSWDGIEAEGSQFQCYGVRPDGTTCSPGGDHPNGWYDIGLRCPDAWTLCEGTHPDRCGIPDICPGTAVCD